MIDWLLRRIGLRRLSIRLNWLLIRLLVSLWSLSVASLRRVSLLWRLLCKGCLRIFFVFFWVNLFGFIWLFLIRVIGIHHVIEGNNIRLVTSHYVYSKYL